jgi:hypothetical protein
VLRERLLRAAFALDGDPRTQWCSRPTAPASHLTIDLGARPSWRATARADRAPSACAPAGRATPFG